MHAEAPTITTERLLLRPAVPADIPAILQFFGDNAAFFKPFFPTLPDTYLTEAHWRWQIAQHQQELRDDRGLKMFVFPQDAPTVIIGNVNFSNFVRGAAHFCHLGYNLAQSAQSLGYMSEAVRAACDYVFAELGMHRIMANYMPHNQPSGRLLRRLGFVVEGYARDYLRINGRWEDHILTSLINPAWQPR
jgi:ribosomal-protein-alanine N-acetyltransferase